MNGRNKLVTLTVVRRTYVVDRESDRDNIDRDFDAHYRDSYQITCEEDSLVQAAIQSLISKNWPGNLSWKSDVEELRIYKKGYFQRKLKQKTLAKDVDGEIHVRLHSPFYVTAHQSPVASRRPSAGYDIMMMATTTAATATAKNTG